MKKRIFAYVLMIALLVSQLSVVAFAADGGENAANSRNGVVRIMVKGPNGGISFGSALIERRFCSTPKIPNAW